MPTNVTVSNQMLALCRAALCGEGEIAFERPSDERMGELYALSAHHDMAHVVSYALYRQGWLDATGETGAKFQRAQMLAVYRYGRQQAELTALCDALESAGIEHLPLKGSELRPLYPEPWMRTSADIDVLVREQDLARATSVLTDTLGYRREAFVSESHDISFRTPTDVHIELHFDLIEEDRVGAVENELCNVWASTHSVAGKAWRREMDDDMFYFYHVAHMAKHFTEGGCGIRTFADLWMLGHRQEHDVSARQRRIERGGLSAFECTARALSEAWFSGAEADDLTRRMAAYVLRGGVFGDATNVVAVHQARGESRLRYALRRIFMPYELLCHAYPSLRGRRYLTFFYQLHRIARAILRGKLRGGVHELSTNQTIDRERIDATARLLAELEITPTPPTEEET